MLTDKLSTQDLDFLDRLRRTRAEIECGGSGRTTESMARWAAGVANRVTSIIDTALANDRQ